ncbi:MAG: hypothetical protein Q9168_003906 [Polycauliona sp. 1 TL-2023]
MAPSVRQTCFFDLPRELRDHIYKEAFPKAVLVTPWAYKWNPSSQIANMVPPNVSLLHTNRQIYSEASAEFYSNTQFCITHPPQDIRRLQTIGSYLDRLTQIHVIVHWVYRSSEKAEWYQMFRDLSCKATGLRRLELQLDAEGSGHLDEGGWGAGKDTQFLAELKNIRSLQSIVLRGYYGEEWVNCLAENKEIEVVEGDRDEECWAALRRYQLGIRTGGFPETSAALCT